MNLVAILVGKGVTNCDYCGSCSSRSDCERNEALIRVERREWSVQFESPVEELWCWVVGRHLEGLRARMALRWSSNLRQGLRFIGKMSNGAPSKQLVPGFRSRASPLDEFGLRSIVVAGLVFCTTSGALCTEQFNGELWDLDHQGGMRGTMLVKVLQHL